MVNNIVRYHIYVFQLKIKVPCGMELHPHFHMRVRLEGGTCTMMLHCIIRFYECRQEHIR